MKFQYVIALYVLQCFTLCFAEPRYCDVMTRHSTEIYVTHFYPDNYHKCWIVKVPEDNYIRLVFRKLDFSNLPCENASVAITDTATGDEYVFCGNDTIPEPIIAENDVNITYTRRVTKEASTSFWLQYHSESLICAQDNHFRCSNHSCINQTKVCDGVEDCENGIDEVGCDKFEISEIQGVKESLKRAIWWLMRRRSSSFGWGRNTHRAITALWLSGNASFQGEDLDEELMVKELELQAALAMGRDSDSSLSENELSMYINALIVTCHNVEDFYGHNLLEILKKKIYYSKFPVTGAYLTLCNANVTVSQSDIKYLAELLRSHSGYPFHSDIQAMAVMALACIMDKQYISDYRNIWNTYNSTIKNMTASQLSDGSFGNDYTTALVMQALFASGQTRNKDWNITSAVRYLMHMVDKYSPDFVSASLVIPLFNGKSLANIEAVHCNESRKQDQRDVISDVINKFSGKIQIKYSLYIGDKKNTVHSVYLRMSANSTAYRAMRMAEMEEPAFQFMETNVAGHTYIYQIGGIGNDPEAGKFWLLYFERDDRYGKNLEHRKESPDKLILKDQDHLVFWYRSAQF